MVLQIIKTLSFMVLMTLCLALTVGIAVQEDKSTEDFHAVRRTRFLDPKDYTKEGIQRKLTIAGTLLFFGISAVLAAIL